MEAILQNFKTGKMQLADVPPVLRPGGIIVRGIIPPVSVGLEG